MTRLTPRLLLMGALLSPATLYALGLGEIHLSSALNQPLDAEIELIAPTQEELQSLRVSIASSETFARYGLDRPQFLSALRFEVGRGKDGGTVVKVTSSRSITEPFVTLLVEASWARGRLLREYTVLLDPPVFMPGGNEAPAVVQAPRTGTPGEGRIERAPAAQPQPAPVPQPRSEPTETLPAPAAAAEAPELEAGSTYTVQNNDTLYQIAQQVRPGSRRVVNQTMIALFRANPDAFAGSIHRLKAGSVLRIPDAAEIEGTSAAEASQEVARQTQEWRAGTDAGHLQLVPAPQAPPEQAAQAPTPPTQPIPSAPPKTQAPVAAPTAAPAPTAPAQPAETQRPVAVPDAGLSQMQERLGEERPPAAEAPPAEAPVAETPAPIEPKKPVRHAPAAPAESGGILDTLGRYWLAIAAALVAALLAVVVVLRRRKQAESESAFPAFNFEERSAPSMSPALDIPDRFDVAEEPEPVAYAPPERAAVAEPAPVVGRSPEDTLSSETAVQLDQQDALAEADFHMAYGLYDQAADLVKIAIEREPSRRDLRLKLLEIYFVWGNKDLFLDAARGLYASRAEASPGEWDKVVIMGRQIAPEEAMFQSDGAPHVDAVDVNLEGGENRVDIDLFGEPDGEQGKDLDIEFGSGEHAAVQTGNDASLDFLLDEPTRGADDEPTREIDPLARTQETPTIESPALARGGAGGRAPVNTEQTAELSLDDLGLDVSSMESTGSFEETGAISETEATQAIRDDEMTQLAPSMELDPTIERPRREMFDINSTGTIAIDQVDFAAAGDTVEQRKPSDLDSTAAFTRPEVDLDLSNLEDSADDGLTVRREQSDEERFSSDVFNLSDGDSEHIDLDVGESLGQEDNAPTNTQALTAEMDLGEELEPVTMSEVGTKLDLARAYMDMGDPDGARSILEEVLEEGNPNQKQEAQRLLEAVK